MSACDYEVRYGSTPTVLGSVQSFTINKGRRQIQDPFRAGTATIEGRNPSSLPTIEIGTSVEIVETNTLNVLFRGVVADYGVNYGIVSTADTWFIQCEDGLAAAGRAVTGASAGWAAGEDTYDAAVSVGLSAGITVVAIYPESENSTLSAQSKPYNNLLNLLNDLVFTEQGRIIGLTDSVGWIGRNWVGVFNPLYEFTDYTVTPTLSPVVFDAVQFASQADSYFDEVVIEPDGLANQSSGSGDRKFTHLSYDETTTQAQNLADYVLATLQVQDAVPLMISAVSEAQSNVAPALALFANAGDPSRPVGLTLRGSQYTVFVEGATLTANPDQTRFTFNVVSSAAQNFFILDSPILGVLDSSRLGF